MSAQTQRLLSMAFDSYKKGVATLKDAAVVLFILQNVGFMKIVKRGLLDLILLSDGSSSADELKH
jgi:hypothetical protein